MSTQLDGKSFVASVEAKVGRKLINGELVGLLYETCVMSDNMRGFDELAFTAKSFRKLDRILSRGVKDESAGLKLRSEMEKSLKEFRDQIEKLVDKLDRSEKDRYVELYIQLTPQSFEKMLSLVSDFSIVKDYFLIERDNKRS